MIQGQEICTLLRLYEELVQFIIGTKVIVIGPFRFSGQIYFWIFFGNLVRAFFRLFGRKWLLKNESVIFLSQNSKYEIL